MEILTKNFRNLSDFPFKKWGFSGLVFLLISISSFAQDKLVNAFKESYALENKGDFNGAIEKIKEVYKVDSYEMNLRLGWLNYQGSKLSESVDFYNKAISLKPYAIEPKFGLVLPLSVQGKWTEVEEVYLRILKIDPQNSQVNYRLGLIYYNRANFEKADPYLEKVVNLYPFDYDGLILLAWNKLSLQKTREATILFQKVLLLNPGDNSALEGLKLLNE
ncbi:MAG: tetratricopeptide repeat protein [Algoriphagus sp.]|uniref:tetratricopeptide repeat protein n=1 Tax=Algoriphagus sp. TaxID=1872435 RepID=UPI002607548C|nr:tetratricopeptide repeat protein [Algoriphagus sp.]MDG1279169.1 tetratricopeptide repeat protein [Algoriphagus sp.]